MQIYVVRVKIFQWNWYFKNKTKTILFNDNFLLKTKNITQTIYQYILLTLSIVYVWITDRSRGNNN